MIDNNILGIILSFALVFGVLTISTLLQKFNVLSEEGTRKFVHIGVSNWWFLMFVFFDNLYLALIAPIVFILLNYLSYKMKLIKAMERSDNKDLGTVYFPIALTLLVIWSFLITNPLIPGLGIFILGYADGFAAVIGKKFGKKKIVNGKSYIGSLTVFLISVVATLIISYFMDIKDPVALIFIALAIGFISTIIELVTPKGLDNLSLPILITAFYSLFVWLISINQTGIIIGFVLSLIVGLLAFLKRSLTISGLIAAVIVGTIIYGFGSYILFILLMVFFISSSVLTKIGDKSEKNARNYLQVLANSSITSILSIIYFITKDQIFIILGLISIAVSTSDTWASELGKLSKGKVISILNFKVIKKGTSGGITLLGILASFIGSLVVASISGLLLLSTFEINILLIITLEILVAGFLGSIIDSYLGILIQEKFVNDSGIIVEKRTSLNEKRISGLPFINNDVVNMLSVLIVTIIFALIY